MKHYTEWIAILTICIYVFIISLSFIFKIHRRLGIFRNDPEKQIEIGRKWFIKSIVFWITPLLISACFFYWKTELSFRWNRFKDDEIGVLLVNFREIPLLEPVPKGNYSDFFMEKTILSKLNCSQSTKVTYKDGPAFITSKSEAISYGTKMHSKIVLFADVRRSASIVRIIPTFITTGDYVWGVGPHIQLNTEIFSRNIEDWTLSESPISTNSVIAAIDRVLVFPIYYDLKQKHLSPKELGQYLMCCQYKYSHLPIEFWIAIVYELGCQGNIESNNSRALGCWEGAYHFMANADSLSFIEPKFLKAQILANICKSFASMNIQDSVDYYFYYSFYTDFHVIMDDSALNRSLLNHSRIAAVEEFFRNKWYQSPIKQIGEYIKKISELYNLRPDTSFTRQFDSLYGK